MKMDGSSDAFGRKTWKEKLQKRLPVTQWLPKYNADKGVSDLIAGVTVGLTVMPQALAYATLAGLEPQYGLYSAFVGCFVYVIFGSCKDITIGPTALMALMTYQQVHNRSIDYAVLLCLLSGIVQLCMAVLNLGVLVDFISVPVTIGFTSATSVIIAASQLKGLLGLQFNSSGFVDTLIKVYTNLDKANVWDLTLGLSCIIILLALRNIKNIKLFPHAKTLNAKQKIVNKAIWLLSTSRNALIVIMCSVLAYYCEQTNEYAGKLQLTGHVRSGLPDISLPPLSTEYQNRVYSFVDMCSELGSSILLVPVIAVLGNVAISKAFAGGGSVDATQELLTLSMCNIIGSFTSSMPITGSFSRSAVNHASGVKTPMSNAYTGAMVVLALTFLTPYFYFIPKASLAAVIICAVIFMIEYEVVKPMWRSSRQDLIPTFATFVFCLTIGVEYGILAGVAINLLILVSASARPTMSIEKKMTTHGDEYLLITLGNSLYFPAVDFIRTKVCRAGITQGSSQLPVIMDCRYVLGADFTAAKGIAALIADFHRRKQMIYFFRPHNKVITVFKGAALEEFQYVSTYSELDYLLQTKKSTNEEELTLLTLENERDENYVAA